MYEHIKCTGEGSSSGRERQHAQTAKETARCTCDNTTEQKNQNKSEVLQSIAVPDSEANE